MKVIDWRFRPPFESYLGGPMYPNGCDASMDDVIKSMDEANIMLGICPFRKGMDNADCLKIDAQYPDRFKTLIHIDPWDGAEGLKDIDKYVVNGPAAGVIVEPSQKHIRQPMTADDKMMYPIYEKCEKENILLTITFGGMMTRDPGFYMPSYIAHVCDDFPKLKIVASHGGFPWAAGICHVAYNHEFLYLAPGVYMSKNQPCLNDYIAAASGWLQDKFIFQSAYSYGSKLAGDLKSRVQEYMSFLPEEVAEKVLYRNAAGLLGIEPLTKFNPIG